MWTNIPKPNNANYTSVNPIGKEQYDQTDLIYDSTATYYDGVNLGAWTNVNKPTSAGYGEETWDKMVIIWDNANENWLNDGWTNVNKPT